eukprot:GEMP01034543.1.p1 GENE.GEMP01034543.1~~GEMP01034543.1.p1  ORF type:complete len:343 (+),score=68.79 GEMP01034543.1:221-1249(+)
MYSVHINSRATETRSEEARGIQPLTRATGWSAEHLDIAYALCLRLEQDDTSTIIGLSDPIPSNIDTASIWSSQAFEKDCVICRHVANDSTASLDVEVQQYHRADLVSQFVAGDSDISIDQVMARIDGPSVSTGYESFPGANHSNLLSAASSSSSEAEDGRHVSDEAADDASSEDDSPRDMQNAADYSMTRHKSTESSAQPLSRRQDIAAAIAPNASSSSSVDAREAWPPKKVDDVVVEPASSKNMPDVRFQSSEYLEVDVQSLHEETNNDSLHRAVEDLAAVVRNLAAQVRGNSESIASLAAIVKQDHDALTRMCSQHDKVIKNLAAALARRSPPDEENYGC